MAGGLPQRGARGDSRVPFADSPKPGLAGEGEERSRLIDAIAKAAAEHGHRDFTVGQVARYAGTTPVAFREHFADKGEGLMAAYDVFLERLRDDVEAACAEHDAWPDSVRSALSAIFSTLVEASAVARLFAVEVAAADLSATARQVTLLDDFAAMLREGRRHYPAAASLPEPTERALVGGVASMVTGRLLAEDTRALSALEPQLAELLLTPYLGQAEARRSAVARAGPGRGG